MDGPIDSPATVADGTVFVSGSGQSVALSAYDAESGSELWSSQTVSGFLRTAPAVREGRVYVQDNVGVVHAYDAKSGAHEWRFETGFATAQSETSYNVPASPTVVADTVYLGGLAGGFYALRTSDGTPRWQTELEERTTATPAVVDDTVVFGTDGGKIVALDAGTGEPVWTYQINDSVTHAPAVADGVVFAAGTGGTIVALAMDDGRRLWEQSPTSKLYCSPSVNDDLVLAGSYVLDPADGQIIEELSKGLRTHVIGQKRTYVGDGDGVVYAFDLSTLDRLWTYNTSSRIGGIDTPALSTDRLIVPAHTEMVAIW